MEIIEIYTNHVKSCLYWARYNRSKLNEKVLYELLGMTGTKTRHFYNNLCSLPDARYLEIGAWKGSSCISSLYMNPHCRATIIDNWSEYSGNPSELISNIEKYVPHQTNYKFIDEDCFALSAPLSMNYNIYLYDGAHDEEAQYRAITDFYKYLDDVSIIVIDDWNHIPTQNGTWRGLKEIGAKIHFKEEIKLTEDGSHTPMNIAANDFWNGMAVFVVQKQE